MTTQRQPGSVGGLLRRYRITAGLSQEALAERAGISVRGLSDLERGLSRVPRLDTLTRIAEALGLDAATRESLVEASGHLDLASLGSRSAPPGARSGSEVDLLSQAPAPRAGSRGTSSLPGYLTDLVGRERDERAIARLLREPTLRLLTLTGPGGVGKTRLAVNVASSLVEVFDDGVVFVPLAPVSGAALVLASIAQALGAGERSDVSLFDAVTLALRNKRILLVIDNFEHVLDAAPVVADVLVASPTVKILVTTRTLLRVGGEHVYDVRPLALPAADHDDRITPDEATQSPAVALFLSRAHAVQPDFAISAENVVGVVEVCRELDGLPLALELAAARVAVLPPAELLGRLKSGLSVLSTGRRDAPARHRALRDAIAWSYDLLTPHEQRLFRWLGVFAGGWSLELAESVCPQPLAANLVFDDLAALVEHSLVQVQQGDDVRPSRFRLLETVREHAQERLTASGEAPAAQRKHAEAMLRLVEEAEWHFLSRDRERWLRRVDVELDNVRAALSWSLTPDGDPELGQRVAGSLSWFWYLRGHLHEGQQWSEKLVACGVKTTYTPGSALVQGTLGSSAIMLGNPAQGLPHMKEAVRLFRLGDDPRLPQGLALLSIALTNLGQPGDAIELLRECASRAASAGDDWFEAYALTNLGAATLRLGDPRAAEDLFRRALELFSGVDDPWGRGIALRALAALGADQLEYAAARTMYSEAVAAFREARDVRGLAQALLGLAKASLRDGASTPAGEAFREALAYRHELGIGAGVARCLAGLAGVTAAQGQYERAAHLLAAAKHFGRLNGVVFADADRTDQQRLAEELSARLTSRRFKLESERAEALTLEETVAEAIATPA